MANSKKASLREVMHLNNRAFKILYHKYPRLFLSGGLYQSLHALSPYVGIYLSAQLINELAGTRNVERLQTWVLAALCSAAVLAFLEAVLQRWQTYEYNVAREDINSIYAQKMIEMDFFFVVSSKTQEDFS